MTEDPDAPVPRTVKARPPAPWDAPEPILHTDGLVVDLTTGETFAGEAECTAFWRRRRRSRYVIFTDEPGALAEELDAAEAAWQGALRLRRGFVPRTGGRAKLLTEEGTVVKAKLPGADRRGTVVCVDTFLETGASGTPARRIERMRRFAVDYLDWCAANGWAPRSSRGSWGAAFLRDPRFWPELRRKVPRCFNQIARRALPGNHYERLVEDPDHPYVAEFDLSGAHHQAARRVRFPHPDELTKGGTFRDDPSLDRRVGPGHINEAAMWRVLALPGLFRLRLRCKPLTRPDEIAGWAWWPAEGGEVTVDVWSSELVDIGRRGAEIVALVGVLASRNECDGLNRYAEWAQGEIAAAGEYRRGWLKPVLLAAYGCLGQGEFAPSVVTNRETAHSKPSPVALGGRIVNAHVAESRRAVEPKYADAIARGLIEAETRAEMWRFCVAMAAESGYARPLALYADGVLLAPYRLHAWSPDRERPDEFPERFDYERWTAEELPELADTILARWQRQGLIRGDWRHKQTHEQFRFAVDGAATHWTSEQDAKLPGLPRGSAARDALRGARTGREPPDG